MTPPAITISWTALRVHTECKQKSHLLRAGKHSPASNIRSYLHGMVVDHLMREWLANPEHPAGWMAAEVPAAVTQVIERAQHDGDGIVRWKSAHDRVEMTDFCVEMAIRLEPLLREHVLPYPWLCGHRFRTTITLPYLDGSPASVTLIGEMDLLVHQPDGYVIWDLKGTRDDQYWRKVVGQLMFYDLAVLAEHHQRTIRVGLIQPMCRQRVLDFIPTDEHRQQMWTHIARMALDLWRDITTCNPDSSRCGFCDVRHACPRFTRTDALLGPALRQEIST